MIDEAAPTTFVLLHGSLLRPWCWDAVGRELSAAGHGVVAPALPFRDPRARSAEHLASIVEHVGAEPRGPLTFVAHSMAGLLTPGIAERFPGARMIYLAGLLPSAGRSLADQLDDEPDMFEPAWAEWGAPPAWEDPERARRFLFHDADPDVADAAIARLEPDSPTLAIERAPAHWPPLPSASICPALDRTIAPAWMRRAALERLGSPALELDAGHCPQISRPQLLAQVLLDAAPLMSVAA